MKLPPSQTASKAGYLPIRAAKVKSNPGAPIVNKGRRPAEPDPDRYEPGPTGQTLWFQTDASHAAMSAPSDEPEPEPCAATSAKYRRLRTLSRDIQRTLEIRLYYLRRVHRWRDSRIAKELDLHPSDFPALAAMAGQL